MRSRPQWTRRAATLACALILLAPWVPGTEAADLQTPAALLAQAKEASGGKAWDGLRTQHSRVRIEAGGREGTAERWASLLTGRSRMRLDVGNATSVTGFDGFVPWSQQGNAPATIDADPQTTALAQNTAYRDRLAFWYPERQGAKMEYAGRKQADGAVFDVVAITPEGGRPYEVWIDLGTHRIERLRESEYNGMRTEIYTDFRDVQGVRVPFAVRIVREDPRFDERYTVELIEYNVPLDHIEFSPPSQRPPQAPSAPQAAPAPGQPAQQPAAPQR